MAETANVKVSIAPEVPELLRMLAGVRRVVSPENPLLYAHFEATLGLDGVPTFDGILQTLKPPKNRTADAEQVEKTHNLGRYLLAMGAMLAGLDDEPQSDSV